MQQCPENSRFADLHNLPKPRWRDALRALAAPALRLHQYRNLHRAMIYDAMREAECGECR